MNIITNLEILFFLYIFIFPSSIHSKNPCPSSSCSSNIYLPIKYPFKLENDRRPKDCQDHIDLKCNDQDQTLINLPSSGEFIVSVIDYYSQEIALSDPQGCIPRRLMALNSSLYPLQAYDYQNYTFFTCPKFRVRYHFQEIGSLSNETNSTIATARLTAEFMEDVYGCKPIGSSLIPVTESTRYNWEFGEIELQLTWNVSKCKACEESISLDSDDNSNSKWPKFFSSPLMVPSVAILATFFGIASFLRLMKLLANDRTTESTTQHSATTPPRTTAETPAPPPQANANGTSSIDHHNSKINNHLTELMVLDEGTSLGIGTSTCPICLEEYKGKDIIKYVPQCGHCFHAECIDLWLEKNTTCPVCRTYISIFRQ